MSGGDRNERSAPRLGFDPNDAAFAALPTPSLVLDADALERNIARMDAFLEQRGAWARPHTKTHKSPEIARLQLARSRTVGVCCARIAEAEALADAGIEPVLVTSPLSTPEKILRHVDLVARAHRVQTVVDSALGIDRLAEAAAAAEVRCEVVLDLDPGFHRTGVPMDERAVGLAGRILERPALSLRGVQMYAGTLMHLESARDRAERSRELWTRAQGIAEQIRGLGAECPVLTGGGTGTFDLDAEIAIATDLQVGSYVFMDAQYRVIESPSSPGASAPFDFFEPALFVVAAAVSQPVPELVTVDAGFKALSLDHPPEVVVPGASGPLRFHFAGDEHGMIDLKAAPGAIALGDRVALLVGHCDPTVNLHRSYVVVRGGEIVDEWEIVARGVA
ncbi:MAG: DSD1 family PLP-dependent enzyme [Acidobacteria bacterium]|nr:MAG: DSD1 family PLP-dependent enzyme [Acidobacteriota bacterium]REK03762.1 MAG: DSD1 family PLP-dependent enzyme [Acidobacteriota bacterium]